MTDLDASADVVDLPPRGPGRPTGEKKTGGRKPGSKNKRTLAGEQVLRPLVPGAKRKIRALLEDKDPEIVLRTATMIFQYCFGKPTERRELSGPDGGAVTMLNIAADAAKLIEALADAPDEPLDGDALKAAQHVAFAHELAKRAGGPVPVPSPDGPRTRETGPPVSDPETKKATPRASEGQENWSNVDQPSGPSDPVPEPPAEPTPPEPGERLRFLGADWYIEGHAPDRANTPPVFELCNSAGMVCRGSFDRVMTQLRRQLNDDPGDWMIEGAPPGPYFEPARPDQASTRPAPVVRRGWDQRRRRG
jgi:hypothetical protein